MEPKQQMDRLGGMRPQAAPARDRWRLGGWAGPSWLQQRRSTAIAALAILGALIFPLLGPDSYWIRVAGWVGLYAMLANGLNIVVGFAGLLDLGYVAFYGLGSYTFAILDSTHFNLHASFLLGLCAAIAVTATAGVLLGIPVLRLRGDYLAIVTLGFGEMVYILLVNLDRPFNLTNGVNGIITIDKPSFFGFSFDDPVRFYYLIIVFLLLVVTVSHRLSKSRLGRAWVALREDETVAAAMGINTTTTKLWAFGLGASFAGAVGSISAAWQGSVFPDSFLFTESVLILSMVILGGMGSIPGAILGAAILVVIPELLRSLAVYRLLVYGLILMVMMIFLPQGIIRSEQRKREMMGEMEAAEAAEETPAVVAEEEPVG